MIKPGTVNIIAFGLAVAFDFAFAFAADSGNAAIAREAGEGFQGMGGGLKGIGGMGGGMKGIGGMGGGMKGIGGMGGGMKGIGGMGGGMKGIGGMGGGMRGLGDAGGGFSDLQSRYHNYYGQRYGENSTRYGENQYSDTTTRYGITTGRYGEPVGSDTTTRYGITTGRYGEPVGGSAGGSLATEYGRAAMYRGVLQRVESARNGAAPGYDAMRVGGGSMFQRMRALEAHPPTSFNHLYVD